MEQPEPKETPKHEPKHHNFAAHLSQWLVPFVLIIAITVLLYMIRSNPVLRPSIDIPHHAELELIVGYAILICEIAAMLVVGLSAIQVTYKFLRGLVDTKYSKKLRSSEILRLQLGHRLSLALEFAVASDILRLAISPTFGDLLFLFVIIMLRFLMNFFLEDEFETIKATDKYPDLDRDSCNDC